MKLIRILFVCHGNICRSPMAEFIMKDLTRKAGREDQFEIASAATSREEIGNDIYPPAKRCLSAHQIPYDRRRARQITEQDLEQFDCIILMDQNNLRNLERRFPDYPREKVSLLMSHAGKNKDVADPWYSDDFETAFRDIEEGCKGLMGELQKRL